MEPMRAEKQTPSETTARKRHRIQSFLRRKVIPLARSAFVVIPAGIAMWSSLAASGAIAQTKAEAKEADKGKQELVLGKMPADTAKVVKAPVKDAQASQIPGSLAGVPLEKINEVLMKDGFYYTSFFGIDRSLDPNLYDPMVVFAMVADWDGGKTLQKIGLSKVDENTKVICKKYDGTEGITYVIGPKGVAMLHIGEKGLVVGYANSANAILNLEFFSNGWIAAITNTDFMVGYPPYDVRGISLKRLISEKENDRTPGQTKFEVIQLPEGTAIKIDAENWQRIWAYVPNIGGFLNAPREPLIGQNEERKTSQVVKK